jgi:hypothetical protein
MSDMQRPVGPGEALEAQGALPAPIPEKEQEALVEKLTDLYERFKSEISPLHQNIDRWHELYEASPKGEKDFPWPGAANYSVPLIMATIDSVHARIAKAIFEVDPIWLAKPRSPGTTQMAKTAEWYLDYWADEADVATKLDMSIHLMLIEGVGVARTDWDRRTRQIPVGRGMPSVPGQPAPTVTEYEGPGIRPISLKDFVLIPSDAPTIEDAVYVGHRVFRTHQQMLDRQRAGIYFNVDRLLEKSQGDSTANRSPLSSKVLATSDSAGQHKETRQYEVVELYGAFDWGDGPAPTLFAFSPEHSILLRIEPYPYEYGRAPYVDFSIFPRPNSFWSRSLAEMLESPQEELTAIHNQRADAVARRIAPPLMLRVGARWDPKEQPWRPGMVIDVNDPSELVELQISDVPNGLFAHEQDIMAFTERMTGMSDVFMGRMGSPYTTATAVNRVTSEGLARMDINISRFQQGMKKLAWTLWWLLYQYRPYLDRFVADGNEYQITKDMMRPREGGLMPFEFVPQGSLSDASKDARRQQLTFLLQASSGPLSQFHPDGIQNLLAEIFHAYDIKDVDTILGPPWSVLQQQIQQAFQMGMQQGMQQAQQAAAQQG